MRIGREPIRLPGVFREASGRLAEGFQKASIRLPEGGREGPGFELTDVSGNFGVFAL